MTPASIHLPEVVVPGKRLGRHICVDARSTQYPAETATDITSIKHASAGLPLDQGETLSCTGHALVGCLNSVPHWKAGQRAMGEPDAFKVYSTEEALMGYGPYPPNDNGGSGLEVCVAAKQLGWLAFYQHATGIHAALRALVIRPVITGVNWMTSFDTPDANGVVSIAPGASVRGGHEIVADEIDAANHLVWFWNSWGPGFGLGGRFAMKWDTWDTLLQQGGDVTVPRTAPGWKA